MQNSQENLALYCISGVSLGVFWAWGSSFWGSVFIFIFFIIYYFKGLLSNNVQAHHIHTPKRERESSQKLSSRKFGILDKFAFWRFERNHCLKVWTYNSTFQAIIMSHVTLKYVKVPNTITNGVSRLEQIPLSLK